MVHKLGKRPFAADARDLKLAAVEVALPTLPKLPFGYGNLFTDWGILGNGPDDSVQPGFAGAGDCVLAGADHETELWNKLAGHPATFNGRNAIQDYSAITGYVIGDDATDQGTEVRAAMAYRKTTGVIDASGTRHKIDAYVQVTPKDWEMMIRCVFTFGVVGMGFEFPDSAMQQFDAGQPWDVVAGSAIDGGHYVPVVGSPDPLTKAACVTWGKRQVMTRAFYEQYNDEAWVPLTKESLLPATNIRHVDWNRLSSMLASL